jgi:hypothetical protein
MALISSHLHHTDFHLTTINIMPTLDERLAGIDMDKSADDGPHLMSRQSTIAHPLEATYGYR